MYKIYDYISELSLYHPSQFYIHMVSIGKKVIDSIHNSLSNHHPIFLNTYHFMFHYMSSLATWHVVILVLEILKTHVWFHDF